MSTPQRKDREKQVAFLSQGPTTRPRLNKTKLGPESVSCPCPGLGLLPWVACWLLQEFSRSCLPQDSPQAFSRSQLTCQLCWGHP